MLAIRTSSPSQEEANIVTPSELEFNSKQTRTKKRTSERTDTLIKTPHLSQMNTSLEKPRTLRFKRKRSKISKRTVMLRPQLKIEIPSNFCEILPGLYLGEVVSALNQEDLNEFDISAVVNCSTSQKNYFPDIEYFNVRVLDSGDPESVAKLSQALLPSAKFINSHLSRGRKVLVHCHRGLSRSPTIIAAYLIIYQNYSLGQAIRAIRKKRFIKPREEFKNLLARIEEKFQQASKSFKSPIV